MCLACTTLLIGCEVVSLGDPDDDGTLLQFWVMGREGEAVGELVEAFELRNPGIRVRIQRIPWSAAHEKLLTAHVGEVMPDIFQLGNTWVPELAALDAIEPLDRYLDESLQLHPDGFFTGILATNRVGDSLYALPWYVDTRLLFYRSDLMAAAGVTAPPETWTDWLAAMAAAGNAGGTRRHAVMLPLSEWAPLVIFAMQNGARLLRDDGRWGDFESPEFRSAFEFYVGLYAAGLAPAASGNQVANLYQEFTRGNVVSFISGPWSLGELRRRLPPRLQDAWATAPLPAPDARWPGVSLAGGASLAIARTSANKTAAWRLIEFLSEPANQAVFYRLTGDLPAVRAAWRGADIREDPKAKAFWQQLHAVRSTPKIPEWERITRLISRAVESVVLGLTDIDDALAKLNDDVDAVLEKRRWILATSTIDEGRAARAD